MAPKTPKRRPPKARETKIKTGGRLMFEKGKKEVKKFFSICLINKRPAKTKRAFNQESRKTKIKTIAKAVRGPKKGITSKTPTKTEKVKG